MGKPSDSTPNFDFLSQMAGGNGEAEPNFGAAPKETENALPTSFPETTNPQSESPEEPVQPESKANTPESGDEKSPATSESPESKLSEDNTEVSEQDSVFFELEDLPDAEENVSDGSTLVIQKSSPFEKFELPEEEFMSGEPTEPLVPNNPLPANDDEQTVKIPAPQQEQTIPAEDFSNSAPQREISIDSSAPPSPPRVNQDAADVIENEEPDSSKAEEIGVDPSPEKSQAPPVEEPLSAESEKPPGNEPGSPSKSSSIPEPKFMGMNQRTALILLASYASAITLLFIMSFLSEGKSHDLESLPDVIPEAQSKLSYVPVHAPLAPGHTLHVGDKERFGNLEVEVLRITREPIRFVHYSGDTSRTKEPTDPVWKLWLKFTNVSKEQTFAPLDRELTLRWIDKGEQMREYSNYYICPAGAQDPNTETVQMYRLPKASDWDMQDQNLGKELAPGESVEAFIATNNEQPINLTGDLVWRFQFRKGISPNNYGVTTMVEVAFSEEEVVTKS